MKNGSIHRLGCEILRTKMPFECKSETCDSLIQSDAKSWSIKYYKGLGTFTSKEFREYFTKLDYHVESFVNTGESCGDSLGPGPICH